MAPKRAPNWKGDLKVPGGGKGHPGRVREGMGREGMWRRRKWEGIHDQELESQILKSWAVLGSKELFLDYPATSEGMGVVEVDGEFKYTEFVKSWCAHYPRLLYRWSDLSSACANVLKEKKN